MKPIHVWLPLLGPGIGHAEVRRDVQRSYQVWQGQAVVWHDPTVKEPVSWRITHGPLHFREVAVPSEHRDRVEVFHVGANGSVFGLGLALFPGGRVDGLLDAFLNLPPCGAVESRLLPWQLTIDIPTITDARVVYTSTTLYARPLSPFPTEEVSTDGRTVSASWSPDTHPWPPVSPSAERRQDDGAFMVGHFQGLPFARHRQTPHVAGLPLRIHWPEPLTCLFPAGSDLDDVWEWHKMVAIAKQRGDDLDGALREATTAAAGFVTEGWTTMELAWFYPALLESGEKVSYQAEGRYGLHFRSLDEALRSPAWGESMAQRIPIRQAWGAAGFFWALAPTICVH